MAFAGGGFQNLRENIESYSGLEADKALLQAQFDHAAYTDLPEKIADKYRFQTIEEYKNGEYKPYFQQIQYAKSFVHSIQEAGFNKDI